MKRSGFPLLLFAALALVPALACRRSHVKGTVAVDNVLHAWGAGGFETSAVQSAEPDAWNAALCSRGVVAGLDVLLCEYRDDQTLAAGEEKIMNDWRQESTPTGAEVRSSRTLLAIADRTQVDPDGRKIARLIKMFREQRGD